MLDRKEAFPFCLNVHEKSPFIGCEQVNTKTFEKYLKLVELKFYKITST